MLLEPIGPLKVNPDVLKNIKPMKKTHIHGVALIHKQIMGNTLWGKLGLGFLEEVYSKLLEHPSFIGYVYLHNGRVGGFIAGSDNGPKMMRETLKSGWKKLFFPLLKGVILSPSVFAPLVFTTRYFNISALPGLENVTGESMFCAFEKRFRGKRISGLINQVLFNELANRGHKSIKITTEIDNKGAIRQLESWGFERVGTFKFYGKTHMAWKLDFSTSGRVNRDDLFEI